MDRTGENWRREATWGERRYGNRPANRTGPPGNAGKGWTASKPSSSCSSRSRWKINLFWRIWGRLGGCKGSAAVSRLLKEAEKRYQKELRTVQERRRERQKKQIESWYAICGRKIRPQKLKKEWEEESARTFLVVVADHIVPHKSQYQADESQGNKHPLVVCHVSSPWWKRILLPKI